MEGKKIRLKRLFKYSDRTFIVAMDHGTTLGPIDGLIDIGKAVRSVFEGKVDAVVVHKGLIREIAKSLEPTNGELIVHLSASTEMSPHKNRKDLVSSVEHAIRLGASAISIHVNFGNEYEPEMLKHLGKIAEECDQWGMPLLAMVYVRDGSKENEFNPDKIKHAARVAEELGADIVKVNYTGSPETFKQVTSAVKIPVVIAGGQKVDSTSDLLGMIADAVQAGAAGVSIGRNVFQANDPALLSADIRKILNEGLTRKQLNDLPSLRNLKL